MKIGVENLIRNGHAEYGDNTGFESFDYNASGGAVGGAGCFSVTGRKNVLGSDYIPVNPHDNYEISLFWRTGMAGTVIYGGFEAYDEDKNVIRAENSYRISALDSTLYDDYTAGDLTVKVTPAASAWTVGYYMQFGVLDYGADQPNFNIRKITAIDDSNPSYWLIALNSGLYQDYAAGSACGIAIYDYYSYCLGNYVSPGTSFVKTSAEISGMNRWDEKRSFNVFPRGTRYIRLVLLANYVNTGDTTYIDGVTLRRVR